MHTKLKQSAYDTPSLNIIPLLDVLLVLAAVLMLLTPFMAKSIHVDLPEASTGAVMTQDTAITLEITSAGAVLFEGNPVNDWAALDTRMAGATAAKVFADKGAAFAAVTTVLDHLGQHDIHNIQFALKP